MVALLLGEAEEPFLQVIVPAVPERQGEAEELMVVAPSAQAVLVPAIGA